MSAVSSLIAGRPADGASGGIITVRNPSLLDDVLSEAALGDASTIVDACRAAREVQTRWSRVPAPVRGRAIQQIGRLVEDNKDALAALITREIGKPYRESLGEVQEVIDTCGFFQSEGRRLYGQTVPSEMPDKQLFTFRAPVGVAAIVTAGNFPVAVPSWYIVPALLCGNAVVWKPAEYTPVTAQAFSELFLHGGLPAGAFNMVLADGGEMVTVRVTDTGIGIAAKDLPHVFDKFYRVKSRATRDIAGTGLGLAITRTIVEACGGRIRVDSVEGSGTTFTLELPLARS